MLVLQGRLLKDESVPILSRKMRFILLFAFMSFLSFATLECVYAVLAHSLAMLGDGASTVIDAATYLVNLYAIIMADEQPSKLTRLIQLLAPAISALVLSGITTWITVAAVQQLIAPATPVNTTTMLVFGLVNLAIDVANIACFSLFPEAFRTVLQVAMAPAFN